MDIKEALSALKLKFITENGIPVERASITRGEWDAVKDSLRELKNECTENDMIFGSIWEATEGIEPNDFALSYPIVRNVWDLQCAVKDISDRDLKKHPGGGVVATAESIKSPSVLSRSEMVWLAVFGRLAVQSDDIGASKEMADIALEIFTRRFGKDGEEESDA